MKASLSQMTALCILLSVVPWASPSAEDSGRVAFPESDVFLPLVADPKQPRFFVSFVETESSVSSFTGAWVGVGDTLGLMRWSRENSQEGWQLSVFGSVFSQFNLDAESSDLINSDFIVGFPLTFRRGPFSTRLRLLHQSSHLGDELILGGEGPERINLSLELADALLAWEWRGWRWYAGGGYAVRRDPKDLDRRGLHAGAEYRSRAGWIFGKTWVAGLDVKWFEETDWNAGVSLRAGVELGRPYPERRGVTVGLDAYDGFSPFGQFFGEEIEYYGISLSAEF